MARINHLGQTDSGEYHKIWTSLGLLNYCELSHRICMYGYVLHFIVATGPLQILQESQKILGEASETDIF